jgi:hypothetical protein
MWQLAWLGVLAIVPLVITMTGFVAVVLAGPEAIEFPRAELPRAEPLPDHCNWSCHNSGCFHAPVLPGVLAGDRGLYGLAMKALYRLGSHLDSRRGVGYGLANLLVFCGAWPVVTYGLWLVLLWQRWRLLRIREAITHA